MADLAGPPASPGGEAEALLPDPSTRLPVGRYRLELVAEEPLRLPGYPGSAWRGALGHALRRTVCVTREPACTGCLLYRSCVYPYVFETPPPLGAAKMRRYPAAPHPFVLQVEGDPAAEGGPGVASALDASLAPRDVRAGEPVTLGLGLFGRANRELPYFVHALGQAAAGGIGGGRGRLALQAVSQQVRVQGPWAVVYEAGGALAAQPVSAPGPAPVAAGRARMVLATPLRLRRDDRYLGPEDLRFADLFSSLLRRVSMLTYFHTDTPLETDFAGLSAEARKVALLDPRLTWLDWTRYSSRQDTTLQMGGMVGEVTVDLSEHPRLWPYLWLGQWTHAGKGTSMGLGRYRLD
jgi:hypothetical protein